MATSFEYDGNIYDIRFDIKSLTRYEEVKGSVMAKFATNAGMLPIPVLRDLISVGLFNAEGNKVGQKQAADIAMEHLQEAGLLKVSNEVAEALERDCPFLLVGSESDTIG